MQFVRYASRCFVVCIPLAVLGCVAVQIPPEQLKNYALLVPQDIYGSGSAVTEIDSGPNRSQVMGTAEGPNIVPGLRTRPGANLLPGRHSVQVFTCHSSDTRSCTPDIYVFEARPGLAYIFRGPNANIDVFNRFDKSERGHLHPIANHEFVTDQDFMAIRNRELKQVADAGLAITEQRKRDQPLIRKIGARICQERGQGVIYIGYVEGITDDKVQIRISDAQFKGSPENRPGGFSPTIIWDSPMQWDLCR
jgi:hypothetical protein